jgi:hypothetical protein
MAVQDGCALHESHETQYGKYAILVLCKAKYTKQEGMLYVAMD